MDKIDLPERQKMTDISYIETDPIKLREQARGWAEDLLKAFKRQHEAKEDEALNGIARWAGVTKTIIWKLKYRPPQRLDVSIYNRLQVAHARYVKSPEATIAENLQALRQLPSDPRRDRLMASMEEFIRASESPEV